MINMSIDENNAYDITERLAFPRLIGSEGEKKAIEVVVDEFKKAGYDDIQRERFKTSFLNWIFARYVFLPLAGFLILFGLLPFISARINSTLNTDFRTYSILTWITLVGFFIAGYKTLGMVSSNKIGLMKDESKNFETENIYVNLKSKNSKATIVYMAHWDTKSQTFPSFVRIIIIMIAAFGDLAMLFLYLVLSIIEFFMPIDILVLDYILLIVCIVLAVIGTLNFFNKTANKSPGAIDNGASVGTVIELARYFKNNPLDNIDFIFLSTSSEELNLGGAKVFIQKHEKKFDPKSTYFINFDGIGGKGIIRVITAYGIPRKSSSDKLNELLLESSKELNIDAKTIYLPTGAWSDFMPIIQKGFDACWLASMGSTKYVHTKKDTMDLVSKEGLKNGLLLSVDVAKKLNDEVS